MGPHANTGFALSKARLLHTADTRSRPRPHIVQLRTIDQVNIETHASLDVGSLWELVTHCHEDCVSVRLPPIRSLCDYQAVPCRREDALPGL